MERLPQIIVGAIAKTKQDISLEKCIFICMKIHILFVTFRGRQPGATKQCLLGEEISSFKSAYLCAQEYLYLYKY